MRVLALLADFPDPPVSGSKVRNHRLWAELEKLGIEVRILGTHFDRAKGASFRANDGKAEYFFPERLSRPAKARELLFRSYHEWFHSRALENEARELLRDWRPDVVHAEELRMARYLLDLKDDISAKKTLTLHNVESDLILKTGSFPFQLGRTTFDRQHARSLLRFEREVIGSADHVFAYSEANRNRYLELYPGAPITATRNGVAARSIEPTPEPEARRALIVGSLGYAPNIRGLFWFLDRVLPRIPADLEVIVAGSSATPAVRERLARECVRFVDTPSDLAPLYRESSICLAPVFEGSGTRTKILEALAHQRLVVTTRLGVEGLNLSEGTGFVLADDEEAFYRQITAYAGPSEGKMRITHQGREAVVRDYDWSVAAQELKSAWEKINAV